MKIKILLTVTSFLIGLASGAFWFKSPSGTSIIVETNISAFGTFRETDAKDEYLASLTPSKEPRSLHDGIRLFRRGNAVTFLLRDQNTLMLLKVLSVEDEQMKVQALSPNPIEAFKMMAGRPN